MREAHKLSSVSEFPQRLARDVRPSPSSSPQKSSLDNLSTFHSTYRMTQNTYSVSPDRSARPKSPTNLFRPSKRSSSQPAASGDTLRAPRQNCVHPTSPLAAPSLIRSIGLNPILPLCRCVPSESPLCPPLCALCDLGVLCVKSGSRFRNHHTDNQFTQFAFVVTRRCTQQKQSTNH